jgi:hypothetical protein
MIRCAADPRLVKMERRISQDHTLLCGPDGAPASALLLAAIIFIFGPGPQREAQGKARRINDFRNAYWHPDCPWISASVPDRL